MRVKIFTEGGNDIGLGHVSRCSSLYDEVLRKGIEVDFIINGNISNIEFLHNKEIMNHNWLRKEYLSKSISEDDYCIVDSYIAGKELYELISELSRKSLYIDDIGRLDYPTGIIVNPSLDTSHITYPSNSVNIILSGPEFVILRPPFKGVKRGGLSETVRRVLISMGGTDIRELTPLIIDKICLENPDILFDVIIGTMKSDLGIIQNQNRITLHCNLNASEMMNVMMRSDIAITAAGQTIYELLATHTPFIPIKTIENQENNVRGLKKFNPNQIVLNFDDNDLISNLETALREMRALSVRKELNEKYKGLIDGLGSKRIIDEFLLEE